MSFQFLLDHGDNVTIIWFPTAFYQGNYEIKESYCFTERFIGFLSKVDS